MNDAAIDLRLWRQFLAVAEELHFGRAALRLHMTQPPLTQAIANLERLVGARLFDRTRRSVQLTAAGEALVPRVRELLARAQALPELARAAAGGQVGTLRLAFVSTVGFGALPEWLLAFRTQQPGIACELLEATSDVQLDALARGEIDAGFLLHSPGAAPPGWGRLRVTQETMVLALPAQHALARARGFPWPQVLDEPLVMFPRRISPSLHDALVAMYHAEGRTPRLAQEAIQMQTIVNLVSAGLGVAWVPGSVRQFQRPGVRYREPGGAIARHVPGCETSLVWNAGRPSPVLERFLAFMRQQMRGRA